VVAGNPPGAWYLIGGTLLAALACELSYRSFQKSKRAFSDVM